jgi:acetamidase/formamidase
MRLPVLMAGLLGFSAMATAGEPVRNIHRLLATPDTVAYGYYWADAKPVLRIAFNRELVAGSTLYIPVFATGALFEIGDGHAAQGDGEVDQTAIETSLRGRLQLTVRKDMKLKWPRAETRRDYISMATDPDLAVATQAAIQEMVDYLVAEKHLTQHQAYQLVSIAGNVAVTQLVDKPNLGVHVRLPKSIFQGHP